MTNTKNPQSCHKVEIVYTDKDGNQSILASNTFFPYEGMRWEETFDATQVPTMPWAVLRGVSYLCLKAACTKFPLDPDFLPGVAAVAAYREADRSQKSAVVQGSSEPKVIRDHSLRRPEPALRWTTGRTPHLMGHFSSPWCQRDADTIVQDLKFMGSVGKGAATSSGDSLTIYIPSHVYGMLVGRTLTSWGTDMILDAYRRLEGSVHVHPSDDFTGVSVFTTEGERKIPFHGITSEDHGTMRVRRGPPSEVIIEPPGSV